MNFLDGSMLRFAPPSTSASDVKAYYLEGSKPFRADYYLENEGIGVWGGKGAERLGLRGRIQRLPFEQLADNLNPITLERLTLRNKANRRVSTDLSFHVPKSVSLAWAFGKDDRIIRLIQDATRETLALMEPHAQVRVRREADQERLGITERDSGEWTYAMFTHLTARPPKGSDVPDPLLHVHAVLFNHSWDPVEQRFKALDLGQVRRDSPYYQAVFHSIVAKGLQDLGYPIERRGGKHVAGYEIAGITPELIREFSQRDREIRAEIKRLGLVDPAKKARVAERTRGKKHRPYSLDQLRERWAKRLTLKDRAALAFMRRAPKAPDLSPNRAMDQAVEHCFERNASVGAKELIRQALKIGVGSVTRSETEFAFNRREWLRETDRFGRTRVTTHAMRDAERELADRVRNGLGRCAPLVPGSVQFGTVNGKTLSDEQTEAARELLASTSRHILLSGKAGVGKTTTMKHVERAINAMGRQIIPLAPSAKASRGVLRNEGFRAAETVASFMERADLQRKAVGQVIWIDEASLMGVRAYNQVLDLAEKLDARVILSGDPMQHKSVDAGDVLHTLTQYGGLRPIELSAIRRQRGKYLKAVESMSRGDVVEGFDRLRDMGAVKEVANDQDRYRQLGADYAQTVAEGKTALAVAPTKAEGREVTAWVREHLRHNGVIQGEDREFKHFRDLQLTVAEKKQPQSYEPGDVLQFHKARVPFGPGARLTVLGQDRGQLKVSTGFGPPQDFQKGWATHVTAFRPESVRLAKGDLVMVSHNTWTKNRRTKLDNGYVARIHDFKPNGDVVMRPLSRNRRWGRQPKLVVAGDNGFLQPGYCVTSHKSQGDTVDRVFIAEGEASFGAASREQFYTSVSRGRMNCTVYTDDASRLRRAIERSESVSTALDIAAASEDTGRLERIRTRRPLDALRQWTNTPLDVRRIERQKGRSKTPPNFRLLQQLKGRSRDR